PYVGMAHANAHFRRILHSGVDRDRSVCTVLRWKRICDGILLGRRCGVWWRDHQRPEPWLSRIQTTIRRDRPFQWDRWTSWIILGLQSEVTKVLFRASGQTRTSPAGTAAAGMSLRDSVADCLSVPGDRSSSGRIPLLRRFRR